MRHGTLTIACLAVLAMGLGLVGCGKGDAAGSGSGTTGAANSSSGGGAVVRITGSDTMVNLAQAWAEEYKKITGVTIQVGGGGSGVGIAALLNGTTDMANSSRDITETEVAKLKQKFGKEPVEHVVGLDALAVYTHKDNPIESISIEELAEIYGDGGATTKWSQLGVTNTACTSDEIIRISRQNSSGTYHYFREAVLGTKRDFKLGSIDQSGSKDVVELVARTPCAIGYSGMGYKTDQVNWLKVSAKKGEPGVAPSVETAKNKTYPLARAMYIYSTGEATGEAAKFLDWVAGPAGQAIVQKVGFVPVGPTEEKAAE